MSKLLFRSQSFYLILVVGIGYDLLAYALAMLEQSHPVVISAFVLTLIEGVFIPIGGGLTLSELGRAVYSPNLSAISRRLAEKMDAPEFPVWVYPSNELAAWFQDKVILISKPLVDISTPEELEFVIAHETAHWLKRKPAYVKPLAIVAIIFLGICQAFVRNGLLSDWIGLLSIVVAVFAIWKFATFKKSRAKAMSIELWCDRKAVELTDNPGAAKSLLKKIPHPGEPGSPRWGEHPSLEQRLANLQTATG